MAQTPLESQLKNIRKCDLKPGRLFGSHWKNSEVQNKSKKTEIEGLKSILSNVSSPS